jgi:hypothetical protein
MECIICFDTIESTVNIMKYCNCKFTLHEECYTNMKYYGLLCPICRIKCNDIKQTNYMFYIVTIIIILSIII